MRLEEDRMSHTSDDAVVLPGIIVNAYIDLRGSLESVGLSVRFKRSSFL